MSDRFSIGKSSVAITMIGVTALFLGLTFSPKVVTAEPMRIAYLSPSFDISDAWERVFWAIQGRLDELGVDYEIQSLAVSSHVDHAGQLAQVESVIAKGMNTQIFEEIQTRAKNQTAKLGKEKGECPDAEGLGIRNSHLLAIAPISVLLFFLRAIGKINPPNSCCSTVSCAAQA